MIHFAPTWSDDVYKILKIHDQQKILIVANGSNTETRPELAEVQPYLAGASRLRNLLTGEEIDFNGKAFTVPAMTAGVYLIVE